MDLLNERCLLAQYMGRRLRRLEVERLKEGKEPASVPEPDFLRVVMDDVKEMLENSCEGGWIERVRTINGSNLHFPPTEGERLRIIRRRLQG